MKTLPTLICSGLLMFGLAACQIQKASTVSSPQESATLPSTPVVSQIPAETEVITTPELTTSSGWISHTIQAEQAAVALADLDHDGLPDLVSAGEPELTIWKGTGQGDFTELSRVPGGEHPVDFAIGDINGDGDPDIVVANHDTDYLTLLLGDGRGGFHSAPNSPLMIDVQPHPHAVRLADLDGDGLLDLVVDDRQGEGLLVLPGLGDGRFEGPGLLFPVGGDPYRGMAVGDLNGDGKPDLVTPNPSEVGVLINTSKAQIEFQPANPVDARAPFAVDLGDFNADGRLDLIAASDEGSDVIEVYWGDGQGGFVPVVGSPYHLASGAKKIAIGDFNGDGFADAAVSSYQSSEVRLLYGGVNRLTTGRLPAGGHPWGLAAADLNRDGRDDLVIGDDTAHMATIYLGLDP